MQHADFKIGCLFRNGSGLWRCTDVGTRTILAIKLDFAEVESNRESPWLCDPVHAQRYGWFDGPPYLVIEHVQRNPHEVVRTRRTADRVSRREREERC